MSPVLADFVAKVFFSDVATGRVGIIIEGYSGIAGAARSGSVNYLADFPNVPTVSETIPDFLATGWGVLVAPLNTPEAIIQKVSADLRQVTSQSDLQKKLAELGSYTRPMTPTETTAFVHQQQNIWNPVLADIAQKQQK
jgi:tripartite-type tricarboxylate transporter receptor subunit TctC